MLLHDYILIGAATLFQHVRHPRDGKVDMGADVTRRIAFVEQLERQRKTVPGAREKVIGRIHFRFVPATTALSFSSGRARARK
jgi:hypothetical protein